MSPVHNSVFVVFEQNLVGILALMLVMFHTHDTPWGQSFENMASFTKLEVHSVATSHCHRQQYRKNLVKFCHVVFELCEQTTDRQTDILFTVLCTPPGAK